MASLILASDALIKYAKGTQSIGNLYLFKRKISVDLEGEARAYMQTIRTREALRKPRQQGQSEDKTGKNKIESLHLCFLMFLSAKNCLSFCT